jgi:F0F1-type ATP synthase membrane subunit b/b'
MAFKLTKGELATKSELQEKLSFARQDLDAAIDTANEALRAAIDQMNDALADYNSTLGEARQFVADIVSQAEEDFSDKPERWQEGERGEIVREWIDEWEQAQLDDIELPELEPVAIDAEDHGDLLDQLRDEAE